LNVIKAEGQKVLEHIINNTKNILRKQTEHFAML